MVFYIHFRISGYLNFFLRINTTAVNRKVSQEITRYSKINVRPRIAATYLIFLFLTLKIL